MIINGLHICAIDDNPAFLQLLKRVIADISNALNIRITLSCYTKYTAVDALPEYDIIFLDIEMPELSGFDVANEIIKVSSGKIIYITGIENHVFESYRHFAFDFVRKSNLEHDLIEVMKHYMNTKTVSIQINYKKCVLRIPVNDMKLIQMNRNMLTIFYREKKVTIRDTLKSFLKNNYQLLQMQFAQINRSEILNIDYVQQISNNEIHTCDGAIYVLTNKYMDSFLKKYYTYTYR